MNDSRERRRSIRALFCDRTAIVRSVAIARVLACVALGSVAACTPPKAHVSMGEAYSAGNAAYDELFAAVRELRFQAISAESDAKAAWAALVATLNLEGNSPTELTISEANLRAKKLRDEGVLLHFEIAPEPKVIAVRTRETSLDVDGFVKAIEGAGKRSLEVGERLGQLAIRANELEKKRTTLRAEAPATFRGEPQARRDEIIFELDAAAEVLAQAADMGARWAGASSKFVLDLVRAVETGGGAPPPEPVKVAKGLKKQIANAPQPPAQPPAPVASAAPPPKAAPPPPPKAAPPKAPPPKAPPPPPPKKKPKGGGDDFEP